MDPLTEYVLTDKTYAENLNKKLNRLSVFEQRPRHYKIIGSTWHLTMALALSALAVAAWIGWVYHQNSQRWEN